MGALTTDKLNELIATGEGYTLEFKRTTAHLGREMCAFANSAGGAILLGVEDDGSIAGITDMNRVKSEVQNIARSMEPSLAVDLDVVRNVLVITVPSGPDKPYSANGKFYLRDAATCQQMSRDEIREFFFKEGLIQFDRQPCAGFSMEADFDSRKYRRFADAASLPAGLKSEDVLANLKVTAEGRMTNAGALVFARDVSRFFMQASVVCVLFQGTGKSKVLDKRVFADGVAADFDGAMTWLLAHLNTEYIIGARAREEKLELPEEALREALLNAIAHRDYRYTDHIQVNLFHDRVEIINAGGLVSGLEKKDLGRVSRPRNPLLFSLLERMDLVENIGSGIKRMRDAMRKYGCPDLVIEVTESWFSISFPRLVSEADTGQVTGQDNLLEGSELEKIQSEFEAATGQVTGQVTGHVARQVVLFCVEPKSAKQIQDLLGLKHRETFLNNYLKPLLNSGWIEMAIPDKPTSRLQKYRLTEKGNVIRMQMNHNHE